jgi:hypothetical protein
MKIDELVKNHFAAWIPAFAGMTDFISIQFSIFNFSPVPGVRNLEMTQ